jgi:hypothetical protein
LRQLFCRQYFRDFQEWFGEMERTDGACTARWSAIVCEGLWRGFSKHGQKSGKHVCEKRLSSKTDIKRIIHPKLQNFTIFYHFLPNFITFYILQHYGRHVTTPSHRHPEHKGNPRNWEGGRRRSDDDCFFQI